MGKQIRQIYNSIKDWCNPAPVVEFMVGETGVKPIPLPFGAVGFAFRAPLFVQQTEHEMQPGGVQTFGFDIWTRIPSDHCAILAPIITEWSGGRLLPIPKHFPPGWSGELTYTAFNAHPEEVAALAAEVVGFELHLLPTTGRTWLTDKS